MKGLMRNNFYATAASARVFAVFLLLFGLFAAAVTSQQLQIIYVLTSTAGFSFNALAAARRDAGCKWGKYKLTLPVRRAEIVRSLFWNQLLWLAAGLLTAGAEAWLSWLLHGCLFDLPRDLLTTFALGTSTSLFLGAAFLPLFYLGGEERSEVSMTLSVLFAFALDFAIVSACNQLLEPGQSSALLGAAALTACGVLLFGLSYPLTAAIFRRKEY